MVIPLENHLRELLARVLCKGFCSTYAIHQRHLLPEQKTCSIAKVVDITALLIMRQSHGSGAYFQNERDVLLVIDRRKRPTFIFALLVAVDSVYWIRRAV